MHAFLRFCTRSFTLLCSLSLCSCLYSSSQLQNTRKQQQPTPQQASEPPERPDPTSGWSQEVKKAWSQFTEDGRYRMAEDEDFRFSWKYATRPWVSWWGAFAVIVVDTTRTDQNRFGLILFVEPKDYWSNPEDKRKPLKPVWLYQSRDLSRTRLEQASGEWYVVEYDEEGRKKVCEVDWSERQQKYVCR